MLDVIQSLLVDNHKHFNSVPPIGWYEYFVFLVAIQHDAISIRLVMWPYSNLKIKYLTFLTSGGRMSSHINSFLEDADGYSGP